MSHQKLSMEQLGRMTPEEFRESNKIPVVLILENIRSGLNVGSLFRTADAFLLKGIFCVGYTPTPPHREVLKSALGATETVEWEHREATLPLIQELKEAGFKCYSVEQATNSIELRSFNYSGPMALVLGNEVDGVDQATIAASDGVIEIAQHGTKHSLNVAVAGGIVLYEIFGKSRS
ncbi:MAG: RNA methyltransferase [Flavobacteriales bacterium]|jgi:tRNA G18 (ribose-2'-O)-methylase SpoU